MNKKIVGILVMTLLLSASVLSVAGNMNYNKDDIGGMTTNWLEQAKLVASDGATDDVFGYGASIDGDYALVGAFQHQDETGSAYIFRNTGTSWIEEAKLTASDYTKGDWFGFSVSIYGNYAIIGAPRDDDNGMNSGSVYIFRNTGTGWIEEAKLTASDGTAMDSFGISVSMKGDYAIVGASDDDDSTGSVYIFKNTGTGWIEEAKLTASDGADGDFFGYCVYIEGNYAIVGAEYHADTGAAYIFRNTGTGWIEEAKLTASDGADGDSFGISVYIEGDYAIVGAHRADTGKGYIFRNTGTGWIEEAKLTASDGLTGDWFGRSVLINEEYAIVGASHDDDNSGLVYIFKNTGTGWIEEAKLTASDGAAEDRFGNPILLSGDYLLIGAVYDNSLTGAAYVFKRPKPDLDCIGTLSWTDVKIGETKSGSFTVENIGEPSSMLDWKIESYPIWGTWTISPESGDDLKLEDIPITISVSVVAPDDKNTDFTGNITVININDASDYEIIPVSLSTSKTKTVNMPLFLQKLFQCFLFLNKILNQIIT